jgi:hypothetical protein
MLARGLVLFGVGIGTVASAQPTPMPKVPPAKSGPLVGATEVQKLTAPAGFIDDAIAFDDQRLAYVVADASAKAELHVTTPNQPEIVIDLAPVTLHPIALRLMGPRILVVGTTEDGKQNAALLELTAISKTKPPGTIVYKLGPATHITVITRDGKPRIAVHNATALASGTRHEVELDALETGKRVAAGRAVEVDSVQTSKQLDLKINHWADGMTRAFGIKGGEWDKKENQRSPDVEATYDLITGKFSDRHPIQDLFEQRKRFQTLADAGGTLDFVRMAWDNQTVQAWRGGVAKSLELDQPISAYDPKSLQGVIAGDGTVWLALKVDPVNPDAVARKKADPEYLDIFKVGSDGKAVRKIRVPATGLRHRFGVIRDQIWVLERSSGFDRGGRTLTIYKPET